MVAEEIIADPEEAVSIAGVTGDQVHGVGHSVRIVIQENLDISRTGDRHPAVVGDGHGPGVVSQVVAGKLADHKSFGNAEGRLRGAGSPNRSERDQDEDQGGAHGTVLAVYGVLGTDVFAPPGRSAYLVWNAFLGG